MCRLWNSIVQVSMLKTYGYGHITDGNKLFIACSYWDLYIIEFSLFLFPSSPPSPSPPQKKPESDY